MEGQMQKNLIIVILIIGALIGVVYYSPNQVGAPVQKEEVASSVQSPIEKEIISALNEIYPANEPGVAALLYKQGEVVFRGGFGMANLEHDISIEPDMVFRLGSITKQFTSAGIMMLKEEGKLEIDDPITKFLPDYPTNGHTITIRHLLTHTSGIKSYTSMPDFMKLMRTDLTVDEMMDVFKNEPMDFAPGEKYLYNNSAYFLLGVIIEKLSGQTYEEFLQERIFTPLDMDRAYYGNHNRIIPDRVTGYSKGDNGFINSNYISMSLPYAAGSLISSVDDLLKWNKALFAGEVVSRESLNEMIEPFTLNNGEISTYGFGLGIGSIKGRQLIAHSGGINGFVTYGGYIPEEDIYVAVLGNTDFQARAYESQIMMALALGEPYTKIVPVSIALDELEKLVGIYETEDGLSLEISIMDNNLSFSANGGSATGLVAISNSKFYLKNGFANIVFLTQEDGTKALDFHQDDEGGEGQRAVRKDTE